MSKRLTRIYPRVEPFIAIPSVLAALYSVVVTFYADLLGVDPILLGAALGHLSNVEYLIPLLAIIVSCAIVGFIVWKSRSLQRREAAIFIIAVCLSLLMFRSYVLDTIGPKVKVTLFERIAQASCSGDYDETLSLVEQIIESKRLKNFHTNAIEYQAYIEALQALKRYRQTNAPEAREPFELAQDQILFGIRMSKDYIESYRRATPRARDYQHCASRR